MVLMLCGLDLDGVLCDIGPPVADRIAAAFGVASHPSTWRSYDLRLLQLGIPEDRFATFLDETFSDPTLYAGAPLCEGVQAALHQLRRDGWDLVGITARPPHLARATRAWLSRHRLPVEEVHHTAGGHQGRRGPPARCRRHHRGQSGGGRDAGRGVRLLAARPSVQRGHAGGTSAAAGVLGRRRRSTVQLRLFA